MRCTGYEVVVCELKDEEQDGILAVPLRLVGLVAQTHPVEHQRLHGLWEELCGQLICRRQVGDALNMLHFKALHLLADAAVGTVKPLAEPARYRVK